MHTEHIPIVLRGLFSNSQEAIAGRPYRAVRPPEINALNVFTSIFTTILSILFCFKKIFYLTIFNNFFSIFENVNRIPKHLVIC